jgi:selenocysteine lyase/cysteine desulfurase
MSLKLFVQCREGVEHARTAVAAMVAAQKHEVHFTSSGTGVQMFVRVCGEGGSASLSLIT